MVGVGFVAVGVRLDLVHLEYGFTALHVKLLAIAQHGALARARAERVHLHPEPNRVVILDNFNVSAYTCLQIRNCNAVACFDDAD